MYLLLLRFWYFLKSALTISLFAGGSLYSAKIFDQKESHAICCYLGRSNGNGILLHLRSSGATMNQPSSVREDPQSVPQVLTSDTGP